MQYNLGEYRYDNGKIYEHKFLWFYNLIDNGPYTYLEGVDIVNALKTGHLEYRGHGW